MLRAFFCTKEWVYWAWPGAVLILGLAYFQVQMSVKINVWRGDFFAMLQKALTKPNSVSEAEIYEGLLEFAKIACIAIIASVISGFFEKHWVFRWRQALNDSYARNWRNLRHVEGASQRIQEDTMRFAKMMETLGSALLQAVLTLISFLPLLAQLSGQVKTWPLSFGTFTLGPTWVALFWAIFGALLLALAGIRLPGLEFNNQLVEAAYRKELVYGEDDPSRASMTTLTDLFLEVRRNYFSIFLNYMYFDVARYSYLQFGVIIPYIILVPAISKAEIDLGQMTQIASAFSQVESSLQYPVRSWSTLIDLISVVKRLRAFEREMAFSVTKQHDLVDSSDVDSSDDDSSSDESRTKNARRLCP